MKYTFTLAILLMSFLGLQAQEVTRIQPQQTQTEELGWVAWTQNNIFNPALNLLDENVYQHMTLENTQRAFNWALEQLKACTTSAYNVADYIIKEVTKDPDTPSTLLTKEERQKIKETLESTLKSLEAINIQAATYFGLPQNIMGGILVGLTFLGAKAAIPAVLAAIPLVPYAVYYGAGLGTGYSAYKFITPLIPHVPALASSIDISSIFNSIKNSTIAANTAVAKKLGVSPLLTAGGGTALTLAGTRWLYTSAATALRWGSYGIYLALAWPFLEYTYAFTTEVYRRASEASLSKEEAEALTKEVKRLEAGAQQVATALIKEEDSTQKQVTGKTEL